MNREKQIEKIANVIWENTSIYDEDLTADVAFVLYDAGYRKQSDVIEEYKQRVYRKMEKYTVFGREYIHRIMREVEKEMKGGEQ